MIETVTILAGGDLTSVMHFPSNAFYSLNLSVVDAVLVATVLAKLTGSLHSEMLELAQV